MRKFHALKMLKSSIRSVIKLHVIGQKRLIRTNTWLQIRIIIFNYCEPAEIAIPYALFQLIVGELLNEIKEYILLSLLFICHYFQLFGKKGNIIIYLTIYKTYPSHSSKDSEDLIFVKILTRLTPHNYLASLNLGFEKILRRGDRLPDWFEDTENRRRDSTGNVRLIQGDGSKRERPRGKFFSWVGSREIETFRF